jgi:hypothetical protein
MLQGEIRITSSVISGKNSCPRSGETFWSVFGCRDNAVVIWRTRCKYQEISESCNAVFVWVDRTLGGNLVPQEQHRGTKLYNEHNRKIVLLLGSWTTTTNELKDRLITIKRCDAQTRCTRYNIVIKVVSKVRQVGGFLWVFRFPPPIKTI